MAGNDRSGRYTRKESVLTRRAEERRQDLARYLEGKDPDDTPLSRARILRLYEAQYKEAISGSVSAQKAREAFIEHYIGKPIQQVAMEVSNLTPEERAAAFVEAVEILKRLNAEQNGSDSIN